MKLQAYEWSEMQPQREAERLALLAELGATDSATAALLDGYPEAAAGIAQCPIAWISFLTAEHDVPIAVHGTRARVILADESQAQPLVVGAAPVATQNPALAVPIEADFYLAYFAGFPLVSSSRHVLGGLCVADSQQRTLTLGQQAALTALARTIVQTLELNAALVRARAEVETRNSEREQLAQAMDKLQDVTIASDVRAAELVERNIELQSMAETDGLTGLRNYRSLIQHMKAAFAADEPLAVMLIDIDWFKNFNDAYGHVAGDDTLRTVGHLIAMEAGDANVAARYGGEEFALIVPTSDTKEILRIGERVRQRIERYPWPSRPITVCGGAAVRTANVGTIEDLLRRADDALYAAKRTGKNRVLAWSPR